MLQTVPLSDFRGVYETDYLEFSILILNGELFYLKIDDNDYYPIKIIDRGTYHILEDFEKVIVYQGISDVNKLHYELVDDDYYFIL